jgi:PAS domain S-box-containing protein
MFHAPVKDHSLHHLQSISRSINDAIISADGQGIIISWNPAAERLFQFTAAEAIGQPLSIIVPEQFKEAHEAGIRRVAGGGEQHVIGNTVELLGQRKDGTLFPIELSLSTWTTGEGPFFGGIIRDITTRRLTETLLKEAEKKFRSITETANDAIISADARGLIYSWNRAAQKIFGHEEREVLGLPLTVIIPDQFRSLHEEGISRVTGGGPQHVIGQTVELLGLHKNGHVFPIELSLSTWEIGERRFFCGIIRDITSRKMAEQKLQETNLKLAEKAKKLKLAHEEIKIKKEQLEALSIKLAKYLSRQVYTSIVQGNKEVKIESYRKKLTIFFSDIQGFTEMSDRVESEVLTSVLNKYLNEMSKIAIDFGGTIDKYIGDAIMIFFGDPETLGEQQDAVACTKMALRMREKLLDLRREWDVLGISTPLRVRMGINTGYCTVGNFGSDERLDYTIVGSQVNLASRLESLAEVDQILISQDTYALIKQEVVCTPKGEITVKGLAYPVQTFEVVNLVSEIKSEKEKLQGALQGFNLSIDFHKLSYADKLVAKELLEKAISRLK